MHGHDHHDHGSAGARHGRAFAIGLALNLMYVGAEAFWGLAAHSLALLADAGHNLGDALGLGLAWGAAALARRSGFGRFTYGLRQATVLAALANSVILLLVTGGIAVEAIRRLIQPEPAGGIAILVVAAAGIGVNGVAAWLFAADRAHDINLRAAFQHLLADALVSAGVVLAGAAILLTGWTRIDPAVSLIVSVVILAGTWGLLRDSVLMAMDAVPPGIDRDAVEASLRELPGVVAIHDLHIWALGTTATALTAHLVRPGATLDDALLVDASALLRERHGIAHATLQVECGDPTHPCSLGGGTGGGGPLTARELRSGAHGR